MPAGSVAGGRVKYKNSTDIYDLLESMATPTPGKELLEYGYPAQEDETLLVFRGYSSKETTQTLGLLPSSSSHAMSLLKAMNAITLIVAGGPNRPSVYILHYRPTQEQFEEFTGRSIMLERKHTPNRYDAIINDMVRMREDINRLVSQVSVLEQELAHVRNNIRGSETLP